MRVALFVLFFGVIQTVFGQLVRAVEGINELEVTDRIHVSVVLGDENQVEIYGDLADAVQVIQSGSVLRLKMSGNKVLQGKEVEVKLTVPTLRSIVARKGAQVEFHGDALRGNVLSLSSNEGSRVIAKVEVNDLKANINTGGIMEIYGKTGSLSTTVLAGGSFFGKDLKADNVVARTNGGGRCEVYADKAIDAQTRAGGAIDVYGKPADVKERKIAGGKINFF